MSDHDTETRACPDCDVASVSPRHTAPGKRYRCDNCGHLFDEPVVRETRGNHTKGGSALVSRLLAANVEDADDE